jgi:hypothetical protein
MKWLNLLFIGLLVFAFNACQKHSASELALIQMPNEHAVPASQNKVAPESAAPSDDSKPAPKYFQP